MADADNYLSTPQGYATPDQIKSTYDYAKALLYGNMQQPVHHWTQGVSNMISALVGGNLDYKAGNRERQSQLFDAGQKVSGLRGTGAFQNDSPSDGPSPAPAGQSNNTGVLPRGMRNNNPGNIESGSFTSSEPGYVGSDGRFARFDTMEHGIGAQADLLGRYGKQGINTIHGVVSKWAPASDNNDVSAYSSFVARKLGIDPNQPLDMTNPQVRSSIASAMGEFENGRPVTGASSPAAFSATQDQGGPAVAAVQQAAARKPAAPFQQQLQQPAGGQAPYIDPSLVRPRTNYTPQALTNVIASGWLGQGMKDEAFQAAMQQGQPVSIPYMGGAVLIDPRNPTHQQFMPNGEWKTKKIGDIEQPVFTYSDGRGNVREAPVLRGPAGGVGPQSNAAPGGTPSSAPAAPTGPSGGPDVAGGGQQPAPPQNAPVGLSSPANAGAQAPVKVASLDPSAGAGGGGVVQTVEESKNAPEQQTAAAQGTSPLAQMAQAGPPPGVDPEMWSAYTQKKNFDVNKSIDEEAGKKQVEFAAKKYDTLSGQAQTARKLMPNIDLGLALMNDKNFHSGLLSGAQDTWTRFKAAVLGDKYANAANETFDKLMSGAILDNMKTALGGLGQVRLAEIALLTRANANRTNTDASNRAVLEISRRGVDKIDQLDSMGQQYMSGDEVLDPLTGKQMLGPNLVNGEIAPRRGLDVGYDKLARKFTLDHPSFTPDEIKRYETIFDTGRDPNQPQAPQQGGGAVQPGTVKQFDDNKGGKVNGVWDGQKWVPEGQYKPSPPVSK